MLVKVCIESFIDSWLFKNNNFPLLLTEIMNTHILKYTSSSWGRALKSNLDGLNLSPGVCTDLKNLKLYHVVLIRFISLYYYT